MKTKQKLLRQLAIELGVSHSYLSQVRNGKHPASLKVVSKLRKNGKQNIVANELKCYNFNRTGDSSSGRTTDSESVRPGSNPGSPANY